MAPVVEKDQHEPHEPWFLTAVTASAVTQSTASGRASSAVLTWSSFEVPFFLPTTPAWKNSSQVGRRTR